MSLDLKALEAPITRILTAPGTDLSTISAKRVRKTLLENPDYAVLGLTPEVVKTRRADVDQVIARIFDHVNRAAAVSSGGSKRKREEDEGEGGGEGDADADADGGEEVDGAGGRLPTQPSADAGVVTKSPKKKKGKKSVEESDAALARKLSTEINSRSRRGASLAAAGASSAARKAKRKSKKSAEMVDSGDDEDGDGEAKPKKRSTAKGGFAKEYTLSVPLSAVLAVERLSRPQVVKKLWEYIRQHGLQNPSNKREIVCDDALRAVFAVDKIDMFRMNKVLGSHLHEG